MDKIIFLNREKKAELAQTFKVSRQTVWAALTYRTQSGKAKMLRAAARQRGGIEIGGKREAHTGSFSPDCETSFLTSENKMIQTFSPHVKLEADLTSGKVSIIAEEEEIAVYSNPTMTELSMIQRDAQNIAVQIGK